MGLVAAFVGSAVELFPVALQQDPYIQTFKLQTFQRCERVRMSNHVS